MIVHPRDLTALRQSLGWTQSEAARHCGVSQPAMSAAERGRAPQRQIDEFTDLLTLAHAKMVEEAAEALAAERMEALAAAIPDGPAWQALRAAIKERALDFLDRGEANACDALLEMIPAKEVEALLTEHLEGPSVPEPTPDTMPTPDASPSLPERIDAFLDRYARTRADYDPIYDKPDERFNGPDTAMLASAAASLRAGQTPAPVHSSWAMSGCYRLPSDSAEEIAARGEHDALVSAVNALAHASPAAKAPSMLKTA